MEDVNSITAQRIKKVKAIADSGIEPYGARFADRTSVKDILANFVDSVGKVDRDRVRVAGRLVALRFHGKSIFGNIKTESGTIQIYIKEGAISKEDFDLFAKVDIGDILGIEGELFKTRTGEITINVSKFKMLSKSLRPLPEKWHGLRDVEIRYRQRYLDLIANEDVAAVFLMRSRIITSIRAFLDSRGYLEVETPIMQSLAGGAAGEPFKTHHNAFDSDFYLRLAPELYLKKLIVGGFEKVYEIGRSFRNEGVSTRHNPEFTMLEVYTAYADYTDMMELTQELITGVARDVLGKTELEFKDKKISLDSWEKISFAELMKENFDIDPDEELEGWIKKLKKKGIEFAKCPTGAKRPAGKGENISRSFVINIIEDMLQPKVSDHPVFVTDLYTDLCPLAKAKKSDPRISERFELFIGGLEVANAYSELNDPLEQRERFLNQLKEFKSESRREIDEDYILALEYGMPPTGGLGMGIDRLVMLFANQNSIRDVILFPQLRPKK